MAARLGVGRLEARKLRTRMERRARAFVASREKSDDRPALMEALKA